MILEEATKEAYGYYVKDLNRHSKKSIIAICEICGTFRFQKRSDYHTFCTSCIKIGNKNGLGYKQTDEHKAKESAAKKGKMLGDKNPMFGRIGERSPSFLLKGNKSPNWQGGKVKLICKQCGKKFERKPSEVKTGNGKYCGHSCALKNQRHNIKPHMTSPEIKFKDICIKNNLPFKFVGDGSLWLGSANPDFVHDTKKSVIEVFGDYFHSPLLNRKLRPTATVYGRRKQLKVEGYKLIVLWESDLKREDAEKFIMHTLHKEGVI